MAQIHEKLVAILREVEAIEKTRTNKGQNYKFRGIDDAYNELHGLFAKHGVFILPQLVSYTTTERVTSSGTPMIYTNSIYDFTFISEDGTEAVARLLGEGNDTGDKSSSKAFSSAMKYALMSMFLIPTDEIKDSEYNDLELGVAKDKGERVADNVAESIETGARRRQVQVPTEPIKDAITDPKSRRRTPPPAGDASKLGVTPEQKTDINPDLPF